MFALNPYQANAIFPIYYTYVTVIKLYNSAIMKLPDLLDRESKSVNMFNGKLSERSKQSWWTETGANMIMIGGVDGTRRNLIT